MEIFSIPVSVSDVKLVTERGAAGIPRRSAKFHPSIWGDHFLAYAPDGKVVEEERGELLARLKEQVGDMLTGVPDSSLQKLDLIDTVQRLGVSYHFQSEIEASLLSTYNTSDDCNTENGNDLYAVALRFRLLRQQGHFVSSDVFHQFKNPEGKFKGISSSNLSGFLRRQVNQALKQPIQKALNRVEARQFMSIYQENEEHNEVLLNFAKLDFNRLQKFHQKELGELTKWWKGLDCKRNFPFARDRLVECYFWALGVYFEPQYCLARRILTKVTAMSSIMDDIYDVYGTLDELILFTDAIERWDIEASKELPSYMRHCYQALLDVYSEMEEELIEQGKTGYVSYAKTEMKKLAKAYMKEAYWFHDGYVPTTKEYMKIALTTCGYVMLIATSFLGMGDLVTKRHMEWITNEPLVARAASVICRLKDDMVGHEFEQERGHLASIVECYMKEHGGATKEEAIKEFKKLVTNAWKDIKVECLNPTGVPLTLLERIVNFARVLNLLYKDADGYTHSSTKTKDLVSSVLVHPVA